MSLSELESLKQEALAAVDAAGDADALQQLRVRYLGKKSPLMAVLRGLGKLDKDERAAAGRAANEAKAAVQSALDARAEALAQDRDAGLADREWVDLTMPARRARKGHKHPITQVEDELDSLFRGMGYRVVEGTTAICCGHTRRRSRSAR